MKDITEDGVSVMKIDDLSISPHYWDEKVLFITPVKKPHFGYTFRLGLQMYRMATNHESIIAIELYNKVALTYEKSKIYIQGTGVWIEGHETKKFTYKYGPTNFLYYTKIIVKFKETSGSPSVFLYFTVDYEGKNGDLDSYPDNFADNVYMVAYGVDGLVDTVDSEVYDTYKAYGITKEEMIMFVPLNMNGEEIQNTPSMNPQIFVLTEKYLKTLDDKYVFFGRTSVVITLVKCKMTKYYFYDSVLGFRYNLSLIVDSVDPGTEHSGSYSYAGNKGAFQVFNTNLVFSPGNVKRISLRNENQTSQS